MKILIVNTRHYFGGGDSTYTFNLAELLRQHKHDVSFFAMQDERNLPDPNSDLFASPIDFRALNRRKNLANGWQVLCRSIYSGEARAKFARLLDRVQPDIIHTQSLHGHLTPSVLMEAKARGLPVVWTLHEYKLVCPNTHFLIDSTGVICEACRGGRYYQAAFKRCKKGSLLASLMAALEAYTHQILRVQKQVDQFLAPSQFLRKKLIERGFPAEKVIHLPLFLKDEQFDYSGKDAGYFLFLGRINPIKGIEVLAEAARLTPEVTVLLAGRNEGGQAENLLANLPPNARYLGMKSGQELNDLLHGARALVMPSLWYENQPFVILEAFAAGKPVIASRLGGMEELVVHQERGILTEAGNVDQLAEAMKFIHKGPEMCKKLGKNGFDYVKRVHSPMNHYNQLFNTYLQLLNNDLTRM